MLFAICLCYLLCYSKSSSYYLLCHMLLLFAFTICYLLSAIRKNEYDLLSACRLFLSSTICFAICFTFLPMVIPMCKSLNWLKMDSSSSFVLRCWHWRWRFIRRRNRGHRKWHPFANIPCTNQLRSSPVWRSMGDIIRKMNPIHPIFVKLGNIA